MSQRDAEPLNYEKDGRLLLKADEVALKLGLGRTKVYDMMAKGKLPVVRIDTAVRVPYKRLMEWIEEKTKAA